MIMDYLLRKYKGINTRSIVSEYDVLTFQISNLQTIKWSCDMLVLLFTVITVIANLITVFSVISNLSIFVSNHSVEINILRAIGFTKRHIYIAYSFCCCSMNRYLIITASIMLSPLLCGMGAGILIAFIICKQESLIIDIPLGFKVNSVISCNNLQSDL